MRFEEKIDKILSKAMFSEGYYKDDATKDIKYAVSELVEEIIGEPELLLENKPSTRILNKVIIMRNTLRIEQETRAIELGLEVNE